MIVFLDKEANGSVHLARYSQFIRASVSLSYGCGEDRVLWKDLVRKRECLSGGG